MKYRMYFFVPYNISEIQKGIQAGHAALEYSYKYGQTNEFKSFIEKDKTWIILNGGTTRYSMSGDTGTLNNIGTSLVLNGVPCSEFAEIDLNFALTAVCFLADERVWDKEVYPDFEDFNPVKNIMNMYKGTVTDSSFNVNLRGKLIKEYREWINIIGGEKNEFLRELLKGKHLA